MKDEEEQELSHILATIEILLSSGVIRVIGAEDKDIHGRTPLEVFDIDRNLSITEDPDTRSRRRDALITLINWRDNNPFPEEVPFGDNISVIPSPNSERDVFYDFEEALE